MHEVAQHFGELLFCRSKQEHVVSKVDIREAVVIVVSLANTLSPFSSEKVGSRLSMHLQKSVEEQARLRITLLGPFFALEHATFLKRLTYSCSIPQVLRASQVELCVMESSAFMKSPLMASLFNHSVRRQMIHCLICASEPCLIFCLDLIKSGIKSAVQYCRKQVVQRKQRADRAIVYNIFNVTFFCVSSVSPTVSFPRRILLCLRF